MRRLTAFALMLFIAAMPGGGVAETQDIAAAARSVPRVVLVASDGENVYFVGHGSGVAIAPDLVLTNAHVVELVREERNIAIGVIPPEGKKSYGAKIIAFSPGNDLALLKLDGGRLPPATLFSNAAGDGQSVTAIGYPGAVDRAQGLNLGDLIQPMTPVKTNGAISGGRASKAFDTLLHTAPLASGNSGGPLVDDCGRVLGLNSFGSLSDGSDAEFGFAVSVREIASFLRQAGVQPQRTASACRSMADLEAQERLATAEDRALAAERDNAAEQRRIAAQQAQDRTALNETIARRENMMAIAAVLFGLGILAVGAAGLKHSQKDRKHAVRFGAAGGALLLGALVTFLARPPFDPSTAPAAAPATGPAVNTAAHNGDNLCRIDEMRSRIIVSSTDDVTFNWGAQGCLNGQTQFVTDGNGWSRVFIPDSEAAISVRRFDPQTGIYRSDRYLVDAATADAARALRKSVTVTGCSTDPAARDAIARMQAEVMATLPPLPNERLVYRCAVPEG